MLFRLVFDGFVLLILYDPYFGIYKSRKPSYKNQVIRNMAARERKSVTVKIPETLLNDIDSMIEAGEFNDRTDAVLQALWYQVHKRELRSELMHDIVKDVTSNVLGNLYSDDNKKYFMSLFDELEKSKWSKRFKR